MTEEKKAKGEQAGEGTETQHLTPQSTVPDAGATEEHHDRFKDATDNLKETTEKLWEGTRHAWSTATFKAVQYKQLVQKKIDLAALHKKISAAHHDLGKLIDDLREEGKKNILNLSEVRALMEKLDGYKEAAASLEEEIEKVRIATPTADTPAAEEKQD